MIWPTSKSMTEFGRTTPIGLVIVAAYVAAHYGLSLLSLKLEVARNIALWYLPAGLLFGSLMAARGPWVWWVLVGDVAARTLWAVGVFHHLAWMVVALSISPAIYATVTAVLKSRRVGAGFGSSGAVTALVVGMVLAPAIAAPLNCLMYTVYGVFPVGQLGTIIPSFLIGDLVGIGTLAPLIIAAGSAASDTKGFSWPTGRAVVRTVLFPAAAALALFAAFQSERPEIYTSAKFLMFIPLTVVALREGWQGVAVAIIILNLSIVLALTVHQVPITAIDLQLLLLSYSLFALILGVTIEERRGVERLTQRLAAAVHSSPQALGIIDLSTGTQRFLFVNHALAALSGHSADDLRQISWQNLHGDPLDHGRLEAATARLEHRQPLEVELRLTGAGGPRTVLAKGAPVKEADGQSQTYLMTYFDQTEEQQRQQAEREREKMVSLGHLASGVAHELNNLIHPIINFARLAEQRFDFDPDRVRHYLSRIRTSGFQAGDMVQKILLFARPRPVSRQALVLGDAIGAAVDLIRTRIPLTVSFEFMVHEPAGQVMIDPTEISQIVTNLVLNAAHAVTRDGRIDLTVSAATMSSEFQDLVLPPGAYLRLDVADNGHGMDQATRERIFEPFFSTKPIGEGTGLGLSVVYGLVTAVGGAITVDSEPGKGTVFSVYLPAATGD